MAAVAAEQAGQATHVICSASQCGAIACTSAAASQLRMAVNDEVTLGLREHRVCSVGTVVPTCMRSPVVWSAPAAANPDRGVGRQATFATSSSSTQLGSVRSLRSTYHVSVDLGASCRYQIAFRQVLPDSESSHLMLCDSDKTPNPGQYNQTGVE